MSGDTFQLPCLAVFKDGDCWRPVTKDYEGRVAWLVEGRMTPVFRDEWQGRIGGGGTTVRRLVALRFDVEKNRSE